MCITDILQSCQAHPAKNIVYINQSAARVDVYVCAAFAPRVLCHVSADYLQSRDPPVLLRRQNV